MQFLRNSMTYLCLACACIASAASTANAQFTFDFGISDFTLTPQFNDLSTFNFSIGIDEPLVAGGVYSNPNLSVIEYNIFGVLGDPTPSGFQAFNLPRTIVGNEFYTQGSSLNFSVLSSADLSDGLQFSELADDGTGLIFEFNGREVGTGRYHPALLEFFSDGTGQIQNSNNFGGDNPFDDTDEEIDIDFGEEYIVDLAFSPSLTVATVPEPSSTILLAVIGFAGVMFRRR